MNVELKRKRQKSGLTQQQIADEVGISKGYYSLIERGERRTSYELAFQIAQVLKTKPDAIFLSFESTKSKL